MLLDSLQVCLEDLPLQIDFDTILFEAVDGALSLFGEGARNAICVYLENLNVKKQEIPCRLEVFAEAVRKLLGPSAGTLEVYVVKHLCNKIGMVFEQDKLERLAFCEYVKRTRSKLCEEFVDCIRSGLAVFHLENSSFKLVAANLAAATIMGVTAYQALEKTIDEVYRGAERGVPNLAEIIYLEKTRNLGEIHYRSGSGSAFSVIAFPLSSNRVGLGFRRVIKSEESSGKVVESLQDDKAGPSEWIMELDPEGRHIWPYSLSDLTMRRRRKAEDISK